MDFSLIAKNKSYVKSLKICDMKISAVSCVVMVQLTHLEISATLDGNPATFAAEK